MKKITFFVPLVILLTSLGINLNAQVNGTAVKPIVSSLEKPVYFYLESASDGTVSAVGWTIDARGQVLYPDGDSNKMSYGNIPSNMDNSLWALVSDGSTVKLYNKGTSYYVTQSHSASSTASDVGIVYEAIDETTRQYFFHSSNNSSKLLAWKNSKTDRWSASLGTNSMTSWYFVLPKTNVDLAITNANNLLASTEEGSQPGQYSTESRNTLQSAITAATNVKDSATATEEEKNAAAATLSNAMNTYFSSPLTAYASPRTITVTSSDAAKGTAQITGTSEASITTDEVSVSVTATPNAGFFFDKWTNTTTGDEVSTENPFTYTGEAAISLTANFIEGYYMPMTRYYSAGNPAGQQAIRYITDAAYIIGGKETAIISGVSENPNPLPATTTTGQEVEGGVVDYTSTPITLIAGVTSFDLKIKGKEGGDGLQWTQQNAFVDWNKDFDFTDAGEVGTPTTPMPNGTLNSGEGYTRTITVPADKSTDGATYRMRVIYNEESGDWASSIWNTNKIRNGVAYDFEITFVSAGTRTVTIASQDDTKGTVAIQGTTEKTITTDQSVIAEANATEGYKFQKWINAADNSEVSTENPFTYTESEDIDLLAVFSLQGPTASVASNSVIVKNDVITISSATGTTIKYTTDNTDPTTSATAIEVSSNSAEIAVTAENIRAIAVKGTEMSEEVAVNYHLLNATLGNMYYIQFQRYDASLTLEEKGEGEVLRSAKFVLNNASQQWKIQKGSQDGLYTLTSANGRKVYFTNKFQAATSPSESTDLRFVVSPNQDYSGYEIQREASSNMAMNPFGGSAADKEIGEWNVGDGGNVLMLVSSKDLLNKKIKEVTATHTNTVKPETEFGGYSEASKNDLQNAINTAQGVYDNASATETDVTDAINNLDAALDAFKATQNNDIKLLVSPQANTFRWFTMENTAKFSYAKGKVMTSEGRATGEKFTYTEKAAPATDEQLFRFEISEANSNIVNIINKAGEKYITQNGAIGEDASSNSGVFTLIPLSDGLSFNIKPSTNDAIHAQQSGAHIVNWPGDAGSASAWVINFVKDEPTTGVSNNTSNFEIRVNDGRISITDMKEFELYSVSGQKVNTNQSLEKGVYIIKGENLTQKVIIK